MHDHSTHTDPDSRAQAQTLYAAEPSPQAVRNVLLHQLAQREHSLTASAAVGTVLLMAAVWPHTPLWALAAFGLARAFSLAHSLYMTRRLLVPLHRLDEPQRAQLQCQLERGMLYAGLSWALAVLLLNDPLWTHWTDAFVLLVLVAVGGFMSTTALLTRRALLMFVLSLWLPMLARGLFIEGEGRDWLLLGGTVNLLVQCHFGLWLNRQAHSGVQMQLRNQALLEALGRAHEEERRQAQALVQANVRLHEALSYASRLASHDELTQQLNRRAFLARMDELCAMPLPPGLSMFICLIDLDHFKSINDEHGHQVGDHVLTLAASILQTNLRSQDVLARWGGEEFVVCFTHLTPQGAMTAAQRLRTALEQTRHPDMPPDLRVTGSFGLAAWFPPRQPLDDVLASADRALYEAKHSGRNCVREAVETAIPSEAIPSPPSSAAVLCK